MLVPLKWPEDNSWWAHKIFLDFCNICCHLATNSDSVNFNPFYSRIVKEPQKGHFWGKSTPNRAICRFRSKNCHNQDKLLIEVDFRTKVLFHVILSVLARACGPWSRKAKPLENKPKWAHILKIVVLGTKKWSKSDSDFILLFYRS